MPYDAQARVAKVAAKVEAHKKAKAQAEAHGGDVLKAVQLLESAEWDFADALLAAHPTVDAPGQGRKDQSYEALTTTTHLIEEETGRRYSLSTLRQYRMTAFHWPNDTRMSFAPFTAHRRVHGRPDRVEVLKSLAKDGNRVTDKMVADWIAAHRTTTAKRASGSGVVSSEDSTRTTLRRLMKGLTTPEAEREFLGWVERLAQENHWPVHIKVIE
jgi:hypothetical protein